ncbi:MAG: hypothetical protein QCH35_11415 [Methanomicrobiaceae archaeon]|nr:hypothetical protein [Methanomicrobiaceae archaeon]
MEQLLIGFQYDVIYLLLRYASVDADGTVFTLIIGLMLIVTGVVMQQAGSAGKETLRR